MKFKNTEKRKYKFLSPNSVPQSHTPEVSLLTVSWVSFQKRFFLYNYKNEVSTIYFNTNRIIYTQFWVFFHLKLGQYM